MLQDYDERNEDIIVYVDGELVHRDEAGVSPFDSSVQGGDAVWEGLRLYDGRIFKWKEHMDRLISSAKGLAFQDIPSRETIKEELRKTLEANSMTDEVHIRLTLTRGEKITSGMDPRLNQSGSTLIILPEYKPPVYDKSGIELITSSVRRFPPDGLDPKIHDANLVQSILAKIEANNAGADAALMLDQDGFVAESHGAHVFIVYQGTVYTSETTACQEGITRATVLDICRDNDISHEVKDISLTEVYRADEMFCTGTMGELAPVVEVDGRSIGNGRTGEMTRRLTSYFRELTEHGGERFVETS